MFRRIRSSIARRVAQRLADGLCRFMPGTIRAILDRRRRSLWYHTTASRHRQGVWGFVDRHSVHPGGSFRLMLSAGPESGPVSGHVEVFRIGDHDGGDRQLCFRSESMSVPVHPVSSTAAALGVAWPEALAITAGEAWASGYYSIDFVHRDRPTDEDVAFLVVTAAAPRAGVLVKLATATYQAYNRWGGHNLYARESPSVYEGRGLTPFESKADRGDMVSFDRPTRSEFWEWEYHYVLWLERLAREKGFAVSYATNFDLSRDPELTAGCSLLVSLGHDEYWSKEEFDQTWRRIFEQGGNTLFLGSNTAYWQVRYADVNAPGGAGDEGRQMICFKSMLDPIRFRVAGDPDLHVTARFREENRRPETMLHGVAYQSNFAYRYAEQPPYGYMVADTSLPFFAGTGYAVGDEVAGVIGHEWDCRDPEAEWGCPGEARVQAEDRLWDERRSRIDRIPLDQLRVLFTGKPVDTHGRQGLAEAVYFESGSGARVFASGTNRWTWGLGKPGYVQEPFQRFNRNLVLALLGAAGDRDPARD